MRKAIIERPQSKIVHFKYPRGKDIIQILPLTPKRELLMVELRLLNNKISYRLIEEFISAKADVWIEAKKLLKSAGLESEKFSLLDKGMPYAVGEFPMDIAEYIFLAEDVRIIGKPDFEIHVPYELKKYTLETVISLKKEWQIENDNGIFDLNTL